ncbi:MAG TPA: acyl-CoA dehydrogenase family protein, partial [Dehalococcoidia bacterium]|nr:acyl-CoA dehydrogenase family protein [Dehalococcoidia bacterium]
MNDREQELVQAVRELARGSFTERADAADKAGTFTTENVEELQALNVPGMMLGEAWEGGAMSPEAAVRVVEEIAYGDASTAVALNMYLLIANAVESFPSFPARDAALFDIAKNQALICGAGSVPTSALDTRTSGYRGREDGDDIVIKGRAGFASMSEGATYTIIGGLLEADPEAEDPTVMLTVPRMDTPGLINHMNWSAMGLRGTASHDLEAQDMRIPKTDVFMVPLSLARMAQQNMPLEAIQRRSWG